MTASPISINRAPVLTLWAAVVSQRLGFRWDESLSLGRALAGLNAQSKGRRLGLFGNDRLSLVSGASRVATRSAQTSQRAIFGSFSGEPISYLALFRLTHVSRSGPAPLKGRRLQAIYRISR